MTCPSGLETFRRGKMTPRRAGINCQRFSCQIYCDDISPVRGIFWDIINYSPHPPPTFLYVRCLKELSLDFAYLRIIKTLKSRVFSAASTTA